MRANIVNNKLANFTTNSPDNFALVFTKNLFLETGWIKTVSYKGYWMKLTFIAL